MSIATRIGSMYNNVGYVYDTFELTGTTIDFNKNIENIPKGIRKSYLDIMNNGIEMVWDNWEKVEGTGTAYTLNKTAYAKMKMEYWGNTEQETAVISKNLFDKNNATTQLAQYTSGQDAYFVTTSTTTKMLLIPVNKTGKCAYTVSKIASAKFEVALFNISPGEVITYITESNPGGMPHTRVVDNSATKLTASYLGSDNTKAIGVIYYDSANDTLTEQEIMDSIQIESGTQATDYRPFGPYPTPDFPTEIHTVSGDNTVKVCGKNHLRNLTAYYVVGGTSGGVAYNAIGNSFTPITSPYTTDANYRGAGFIGQVKKGITYTFSCDGFASGLSMSCAIYETFEKMNNNTNQLERFVLTSTNGTFTPNYDGYALLSVMASTSGTTLTWNYAQLEKGEQATSYEAIQTSSYPINLPVENLFDKDTPGSRIYAFINNDGRWVYSGDSYSVRVSCKPNTKYTISANNPDVTVFRAGVTDSNSLPSSNSSVNIYSVTRYTDTNTPIVVETGDNAQYIVIQITAAQATTTFNTLQVEKGTKANQYTPYGTTPIELCKIGNYQDRIFKSTGKNLWDKGSNFTITSNASTWYFINGSANAYGSNIGSKTTYKYLLQSGKTYYFQYFITGTAYASGLVWSDETSSGITRLTDSSKTGLVTFRIVGKNDYIVPRFMVDNGYSISISEVQLEEAKENQPTSYEPYGEPKWYLYKAINKKVFTNEDDFSIASNYTTSSRTAFGITINDIKGISSGNETPNLLSTKFRSVSMNTSWAYGLMSMVTTSGQTKRVYFFLQANKAVEDIQNVLVGEPFYYSLETPTYTEITDTTLLSQLEVIKKSYEGQTNVSQDNNDLPFDLWSIALWED